MANTYNAITVAATATVIAAANTWRRGITIYNNGANTIYVGPDSSIATTTAIPIPVGSSYDFNGFDVYKGPVYGIVAANTEEARFFEWTK